MSDMSNIRPFILSESLDGSASRLDRSSADALAAAIQKPLDALDAAAEAAAKGMLGAAKLGLLVAANGIIDALRAADEEFARQYAAPDSGAASNGIEQTDAASDRSVEHVAR